MTTLLAVRPLAPARSGALESFGPNWFATVMGTGILANAAVTLPVRVPLLPDLAAGVWVLDAALLIAVTVAVLRRPDTSPAMAHFLGAPAMALMTVGAGAVLAGSQLLGPDLALVVDAVLWTTGTVLGLGTALVVPRRSTYLPEEASATWLMPVVPPMVSAATGPLLLAHLSGAAWSGVAAASVAMFGLAAVASSVVVVALVRRLVRHGTGPTASAPTLFLVLGPLGQSATAAHTLAGADVVPAWFGAAWAVPALAVAAGWAAYAGVVVLRSRPTFSMGWWAFTFPVGTCVTGLSGLGLGTLAVLLYASLVAAWAVVTVGTVRHLSTTYSL